MIESVASSLISSLLGTSLPRSISPTRAPHGTETTPQSGPPVPSRVPPEDRAEISPEARRAAARLIDTAEKPPPEVGAALVEATLETVLATAQPAGAQPDSAPAMADATETGERTRGEPTPEETEKVAELRDRDREVRSHEQAHKSAGGQYAGAIHYDFQTGPDGKRYAVGGHVPIDVSPIPDDPQATIRKMDQIQRAALAPADPSSADRQVAATAARQRAQAQADVTAQSSERGSSERGSSEGASSEGAGRSDHSPSAVSSDRAVTEGAAALAGLATAKGEGNVVARRGPNLVPGSDPDSRETNRTLPATRFSPPTVSAGTRIDIRG